MIERLREWLRPGWCPICDAHCDRKAHRNLTRVKWRFFAGWKLDNLRLWVERDKKAHDGDFETPCLFCDSPFEHGTIRQADDCPLETGLWPVSCYELRNGLFQCFECDYRFKLGDLYYGRRVEEACNDDLVVSVVVCFECGALHSGERK